MSTLAINWKSITSLSGDALRREVFGVLRLASSELQASELDDPNLLAVVPRLADLIETRSDLASFGQAFSTLARSVGLWNYIDRTSADARDEIAAEAATIS